MSEAPASPRRMRLVSFRAALKNTLRGFAVVELPNGLRILDIPVHAKGGKAWAGLPGRPVIDGSGRHHTVDGKRQYAKLLEWRSPELGDEFLRRVVDLVRAEHPDALQDESSQ
jgi:hypothetical protein